MSLHKVLIDCPEEEIKDTGEENKDTDDENQGCVCNNLKDETTEVKNKRSFSNEEMKKVLGFSDDYW